MKIAAAGGARLRVTLANDLAFQDILEGDLSYRETTEFLIATRGRWSESWPSSGAARPSSTAALSSISRLEALAYRRA